MRVLHPGDTFPRLTVNIPGAQAIQVPGWLTRSSTRRGTGHAAAGSSGAG